MKHKQQKGSTKEEASKKSLDGLNMFNGTNLTLSHVVDQDDTVSASSRAIRHAMSANDRNQYQLSAERI